MTRQTVPLSVEGVVPHPHEGCVERACDCVQHQLIRLRAIEATFNRGWLPPIPGERGTLRVREMQELRGLVSPAVRDGS